MKKSIVIIALLLFAGMTQNYAQIKLYGLTFQGGETLGTISKFETGSNNLSSVYNFPSGPRNPYMNDLTQAANGKLYGMTQFGGSKTNNQVGGYGTIFSFDPVTNTQKKLYDFDSTNGRNPNGSLVQAIDGKLYGMTTLGGSTDNGTIFSFDPVTNTYTKLLDFNITNGSTPFGSLIQANDGKLYGMTTSDGSTGSGFGTIFSFDPVTNTHTILYDFNNTNSYFPNGSLVQASDGILYGMTREGGSIGGGTIFSFDLATNTHTLLHNFDYTNGNNPYGSLVQANDGKLYGMTNQGGSSGGNGTIFSYDPGTNTHTMLLGFNGTNGTDPFGSLLLASDGKLYGMTSAGGSAGSGYGTIFSFDPVNNSHNKLHDFNISNGQYSNGSLVQASDGKLYGMTYVGGSSGNGTIFSFDPLSNIHSKLHDFNIVNGSKPNGSLVKASNSKLYGMTQFGGSSEVGTIFSFDPETNTHTRLHDFNITNGRNPFGSLVQASDGKLYGVTSQYNGFTATSTGTIFSYDPLTNTHTKLYDFGNIDGRYPNGSLMEANDGKLYGVTSRGGSNGVGAIFSFDPLTNTYSKLYDFNNTNGRYPSGRLLQASDGKLYGTTTQGSSGPKGSTGVGTIFSFDPVTLTYSKLYDFNYTNGKTPTGDLVQANDGKIYGTTNEGGISNFGIIFSFDPLTNTQSKLHDFDFNNGSNPTGSLMQASDGYLYGMTYGGGSSGNGTIFSFDPGTSTYSKLQDFNNINGSKPSYSSLIEIKTYSSPNIFFRSRQSGTWIDPTTWEFSLDSLVWINANRYPNRGDSTILIQNGHEVTSNGTVTLIRPVGDNIVVSNGGILTILTGFNWSTEASRNNRPIFEVNGTLNAFGGIIENRNSIVINGILNVENGTIQNLDGGMIFINGICNVYSGDITKGSSLNPVPSVIVNSSGTMNLLSDNPKTISGPINYGVVNWNRGDLSFGTSQPENYGIWQDSASAYFTSRRLNFKNFGLYNKLGGNSYAQSNSYNFTNTGLLRGFGIMDLGQGGIASNLGRLSPGDSIGSLTLKFRQPMSFDELNIQLGDASGPGTGHDIFTFFGDLSLSGTLNVAELSVMPEGNYTIVRKDSGSLTGTFTNLNLPANYSIQYFTDSVVLVKIQPVPPKNISISNPAAITEGDIGQKELKFVVRLNQVSTGTVMITYTTVDSTALAGEDYATVSGTLIMNAGVLTDTIRVPILGDQLVEVNEKLKVILSNPVNGIITTGTGIGTINNDDALPAVSISNYTLAEGTIKDTLLQVQVRLNASYPLAVTLNYDTQDSTATDGIDYTGASGSLTFTPGDTLAFIPVLIKGDGIDEGNEIIHINLSSPVNATIAAAVRGRITITDDDIIPAITTGNVSITEGNTTDTILQVQVRLNRTYILPVTVNYSSSDSTATDGTDYTGTSGTLTFLPGDTLEYIPVLIKGDRIDEPNEIIKITYSNPVNGTISTTSSRITITDNDLLPAVAFTSINIPEGNNDQFNTVSVTVRLNRSYPLPVSVDYILSDSTAINSLDYQSVQGTLNFAAEDTLESISFTIQGDRVVEPNEIIKLLFSTPVNATVALTPYRITIGNDDSYPVIYLTAPTITEGDAGTVSQQLTVRLSKRYPQPVTVQLSSADISAISGLDYTAINTSLIFPADGDTIQTINVDILGDLLDEANETYLLQLSSPVNATLTGSGNITATITDNDPVPAIRIHDSTSTEFSGIMTMRVALMSPSGRQVKVAYRTQDGTAIYAQDYQRIVSDTIFFNPGETVKFISVPLIMDALTEVNESFSVILSSPVNGTVTTSQGGDNTGIVTIINSPATVSAGTRIWQQPIDNNGVIAASSLKVKVLPNPSQNYFQLNINGNGKGAIHLRITDVLGRVVEERKAEGSSQQIKLGDNWRNGNYFLELTQGSERKIMQLVKLK